MPGCATAGRWPGSTASNPAGGQPGWSEPRPMEHGREALVYPPPERGLRARGAIPTTRNGAWKEESAPRNTRNTRNAGGGYLLVLLFFQSQRGPPPQTWNLSLHDPLEKRWTVPGYDTMSAAFFVWFVYFVVEPALLV